MVTSPLVMDEISTKLFKLEPWTKMIHGFYPCGACKQSVCKTINTEDTLFKEV